MADVTLKKEKKMKKDKRPEEPAVIDLCSDDEARKMKKAKKEKRRAMEAAEAAEAAIAKFETEADVAVSKKLKKEKKQKREADNKVAESGAIPEEESEKPKKEKKRKHEVEEIIPEPVECASEDVPKVKKVKKSKKEKRLADEQVDEQAMETPSTPSKHNTNTADVNVETPKDDNQSGGAKYWKRIDEDKWKSKVVGTKFEKISHFDKGGDSWGNEAANILGQVKGKGFVKAMQKLKRASWKGAGQIDCGVNSVQFSDWED